MGKPMKPSKLKYPKLVGIPPVDGFDPQDKPDLGMRTMKPAFSVPEPVSAREKGMIGFIKNMRIKKA